MRKELMQFIPKDGRTLGMLHDPKFRPDQAPNAQPIEDGRVIFDQNKIGIEEAALVRAPVCLTSEGDNMLIKQMTSKDGFSSLQMLIQTTPTAAVVFDAFRNIGNAKSIVWFCEDQLYAKTFGKILGVDSREILPLFKDQSDGIAKILQSFASLSSQKRVRVVHKLAFSDLQVQETIEQAIADAAKLPDFNSEDRKKLKGSSAAIVASTHTLFIPIAHALIGNQSCAVQGPVHLETNPPHWKGNKTLSTVTRFVDHAAREQPNPHRSLMPCLFAGEPIGEFPALDDNGPQIRRDQRWKLIKWIGQNPFPLDKNPIFGHAIGLLENQEINTCVKIILKAEKELDEELGHTAQMTLTDKIDKILTDVGFWK